MARMKVIQVVEREQKKRRRECVENNNIEIASTLSVQIGRKLETLWKFNP